MYRYGTNPLDFHDWFVPPRVTYIDSPFLCKTLGEAIRNIACGAQDSWVHRLGNLTLSGYNSDLATASFVKKQKLSKDRSFLGHKINIGYQNGLALNSLTFDTKASKVSLADAPHWDAEMIEARTKAMVDMVAKANLLPGEKY